MNGRLEITTNTIIKKLAFTSKKSDGYNPMFYCADEVAAWPGVNGLRQWGVMVSGTGAREEPLGMAISSGGYENEGLFDELMKRGTGFLMGNSREQHILPIIYMIDDPEKKLEWFSFGEGDYVSIHYEASRHLNKALGMIRKRGAKALVAINPATPK